MMGIVDVCFLLLVFVGVISLSSGEQPQLTVPCEIALLDTDKDGYLCKDEVDEYFLSHVDKTEDHSQVVALQRMERFFEKFDFNEDDRVQIEEYYLDQAYQSDCLLKLLLRKKFGQ